MDEPNNHLQLIELLHKHCEQTNELWDGSTIRYSVEECINKSDNW